MLDFSSCVGTFFSSLGGINYVEVGMSGSGGKFKLLVQRDGGRTPAAMYAEQLAINAELRDELSEAALRMVRLRIEKEELERVVAQAD